MLLLGGLGASIAPTDQVGDFNGATRSIRTGAIPRWVISFSRRSQLRYCDGEDKLARKVACIWIYGDSLDPVHGKRCEAAVTLT